MRVHNGFSYQRITVSTFGHRKRACFAMQNPPFGAIKTTVLVLKTHPFEK